MHFNRLRLTGFKSFVDPTDLMIEPGMTGIVGPNGCGKSNLVEALRWVMGEMSAKKMRGGEMDDVIFSGTSEWPARNIAEVSLLLDNSDRAAPAAFNNSDELEVSRRIERDQGSRYLINGQDVRARDVQLLFADAASGASSAAMVSQGQIAEVINAKPQQRRGILEEAAGIKGIHTRRHEAELRLRAAETNLERVDDVVQTLEAQLQGLKRQAAAARLETSSAPGHALPQHQRSHPQRRGYRSAPQMGRGSGNPRRGRGSFGRSRARRGRSHGPRRRRRHGAGGSRGGTAWPARRGGRSGCDPAPPCRRTRQS